MTTLRFDPSHAVKFDLTRGQIEVRDSSERVLVPADALLALWRASEPDAAKDFARKLGTEAGRRALQRLGDAARAEMEAVLDHLGGELALMGFGSLGLERWGQALVFAVSASPFGPEGDEFLASLLEGAVQRAFARDVGVVVLERVDAGARYLVTSRAGAERVRSWLAAGTGWGEALTRLAASGRGEA